MKVEKIWYIGFYSFITVFIGIAITIMVISFRTEPLPDWYVTQSEATGLCYEVHAGKVFEVPVSCP
ncbi:hypothetical protein LCGC14_2671950 [marine sediment metagenome]|uniref:Uncharacterized protein n=1 Tax=marine sediment metagenome TaxID=412755 RepID=A0A0F9CFT1_9ZZZZ